MMKKQIFGSDPKSQKNQSHFPSRFVQAQVTQIPETQSQFHD